jgi:hypothetical protein
MTANVLLKLSNVVQSLEKRGITCVIEMAHDSCGDSAVLVTIDADTCEVYHDLLADPNTGAWEICPGNGIHWVRPLTGAGIIEAHQNIAKYEMAG